MKNRVLAILLASAVTLAGCGEKSSGEDEKWHLINNYTLDDTSRNGTFVTTAYERLDFLDYDSMIQSPVCDDPTCEHKDEKKCPAFGKSNHPFIRNDKLYYFKETDFYNLGEEQYVFDTELWRCDLNGSNDKMLDTFKGLDLRSFDTIVRRGDKLYIPFSKEIFDSDFSCAEPSVVLYEYDLSESKGRKLYESVGFAGSGSNVYGIWEDKLYFCINHAEKNIPYKERVQQFAEEQGIDLSEAWTKYVANDKYVFEYYTYDIKADKVTELTDSIPAGISDKFLYTKDNNKLYAIDKKGEKLELENSEGVNDIKVIDGYTSFNKDMITYLFDEDKQSVTKLNDRYDIMSIAGGNVVYNYVEGYELAYKKVKLDELVS